MNFLAHLYLSFDNKELMIGNFIADAIRGNKFNSFSSEIQKGIILHRNIDTFTDEHPIVRKSKRRLHERYRHYDGVIIDMFFDHFLAKNWKEYSNIPLIVYSESFYKLLHKNYPILPPKTQEMLPYIEKYNWLYNYQFMKGMQSVLEGMNKRTKLKSQMNMAINDLEVKYEEFEQDFRLFFDDLTKYVESRILKL